MELLGKIQPSVIHSERYVLAHLLVDYGNSYKVFGYLRTDECFYKNEHREIFKAMLKYKDSGFDLVKLSNELPEYRIEIVNLSTEAASGIMLEEHAKAIFEAYVKREMIMAGAKLVNSMYEQHSDIVEVINEFTTVQNELLTQTENSDTHIAKALDEMFSLSKRMNENDESLRPIPTGFTYFDEFSGGIQRGDLVVVAGETSNGKTTFSLNVMQNTAGYGTVSAIFSFEMTISQLSARMAAYETRESSKKLIMGKYDLSKLVDVDRNCQRLRGRDIYLVKPPSSNFNRLVTDIVRIVKQKKIEVVVIDYLQLLSNPSGGNTSAEQVGDMANKLKVLAVQLNISIILISQLKRVEGNPRPSINRLKQSGDIENAADTVILTWLPYKYDLGTVKVSGETVDIGENAVIIVGKGRNIGTTEFVLEFKKDVPAFYNYHKEDVEIRNFYESKQITPFD